MSVLPWMVSLTGLDAFTSLSKDMIQVVNAAIATTKMVAKIPMTMTPEPE